MAKKFSDSPEDKKMQQKIEAGANYYLAVLGGQSKKFLNLLPPNKNILKGGDRLIKKGPKDRRDH